MTTSFSVVGSPIEHSLSPVLHSAVYVHLGLDLAYGRNLVLEGELEDFLGSSAVAGVSVTMPLKQEAFSIATSHDKYALLSGVANTLFRKDGTWSAANTDVYGVIQALAPTPEPKLTALIGSGSTARSALVALSQKFPASAISVLARNHQAAIELSEFAASLGFTASPRPVNSHEVLDADLVMSLVPAGSFRELWHEVSEHSAPKTGTLFDVAYNPWPSEAAVAWGSGRVISGIEMLIWQAIEQVQLFIRSTGQETEIDRDSLYQVMKSAVSSK
jgi:shikimate dehydrogenase